MKTLSQVQADRAAAGAAYAIAAQAYIDAFAELHAHDLALASRTGNSNGFPAFQPPTPHADFLRDYIHGGVIDRAVARAEQITRSLEA
jgi:hypothetical protein